MDDGFKIWIAVIALVFCVFGLGTGLKDYYQHVERMAGVCQNQR